MHLDCIPSFQRNPEVLGKMLPLIFAYNENGEKKAYILLELKTCISIVFCTRHLKLYIELDESQEWWRFCPMHN